jgi:hypothetical protein
VAPPGVVEGSGILLAGHHVVASVAAVAAEAAEVLAIAEEGAAAGAVLGTGVAGADAEVLAGAPTPTKGQSRTSRGRRRRLMTRGRVPMQVNIARTEMKINSKIAEFKGSVYCLSFCRVGRQSVPNSRYPVCPGSSFGGRATIDTAPDADELCAASLSLLMGCACLGVEPQHSSSKIAAVASQGAQSMFRDRISNMRTSRNPTARI